MKSATIAVETRASQEIVLLRERIERALAPLEVRSGLCHVYCPHTTAAITVNEGDDPDVGHDLIAYLESLVPWHAPYRHAEGNSAAHIRAALIGPSVTVALAAGRLALGRWQDVYFCEFDGPRRRTVELRVIEG